MLCYDDQNDEHQCFLKPGGQCFSAIHEEYNAEENIVEAIRSFGCISEFDNAMLQCKGDLVPSTNWQSVSCCNFTDLCNKDLMPELKVKPPSFIQPTSSWTRADIICWILLIVLVCALIILAFLVVKLCIQLSKHETSRQKLNRFRYDLTLSTGSGVGHPLLVQTTISRQFERSYCLGRGRFTEVNVGYWNATKIAEKIFSTNEEKRWLQEKRIYESALLQHQNVLGYITSDILESGLRAIYTDYHELGSLHDYLAKTSLNVADFLKLVESAVTAIAYLHTEVLGATKHPPIAHRDISVHNFLVSSSKECVISNFEIAIMPIVVGEDAVVEPDITRGTLAFMAPEVVNGTIKLDSFEAFKMSDIYSLGLVLFDICLRCSTNEGDESLPIPQRWENHKLLKIFPQILRECCYENPKARPNALRLKKSICKIILEHNCEDTLS